MEALVRWQHPSMGLVSPAKFIPLAEDTGMIVEIDQIVMKTALEQVTKWRKENLSTGVLSLNLSMKQLKAKNFIQMIQKNIEQYNFDPSLLGLEVTEGYVMQNPEEAIVKLNKLSDLGIKIAIDDFGTGYSSLSYLKKLPVKTLKIDQSFIRDIPEDEEDEAIVKAIIVLANSLNMEVIAEGVENEKQLTFLLQNHCNNIQGYYYAKPMPADEMKAYIKTK
jgi:EAL domain-containing protein (putative c-di-GMP-specific phosphodiesterase class I)